jgi:cobalt/nickel transport system permease protein
MILVCTTLFSLTTPSRQLIGGLNSLGLANWMVTVFFLMQRYIVILKGELQRQVNAFRSRYIRLNPVWRLKYFSGLLAVFSVRTFGRSERLYQTMLSRGFNGRIYTTVEQNWNSSDSWILAGNLVFFTLTLIAV